jgi:hypothetical protein
MKLIVAEVIWEVPADYRPGDAVTRPEGCTWIPDALVYIQTSPDAPKWIDRRHYRAGRRERCQGVRRT